MSIETQVGRLVRMFRIIQVRDDEDHLDFAMLGGLRFWHCSRPGASRSQLLAH